MVSSSLWISVDKQMYCRRNEAFDKIDKFLSCERKQCKNVTALRFATGPRLNLSERLPLSSNLDEHYCRWQQMLNGPYIKLSVNRASMICGCISMIIKQWLVSATHNHCIGSCYRQKREQHSHRPILRMSGNAVSTIFGFASWIIYVLFCCRHQVFRHWYRPLLRQQHQ